MMNGIQPSEAKALTYWEYTAMLTEWNERHKTDGDKFDPSRPPDPELVDMMKGMVH